jgi:hypothetical protein
MTAIAIVSILGIGAAAGAAILYLSAGCYLQLGDSLFALVGVSCPVLW